MAIFADSRKEARCGCWTGYGERKMVRRLSRSHRSGREKRFGGNDNGARPMCSRNITNPSTVGRWIRLIQGNRAVTNRWVLDGCIGAKMGFDGCPVQWERDQMRTGYGRIDLRGSRSNVMLERHKRCFLLLAVPSPSASPHAPDDRDLLRYHTGGKLP